MANDRHRRDVDMSEAAINRRMRTLGELYRFWRCVERSRRQQNALDRLRIEEELTAKHAENAKGEEKRPVKRFGKGKTKDEGPTLFDMEGLT